MQVIPLGNRVLVRPAEQEKKTPGGILLPDNAKEKPQQGTVIEVGPGKTLADGTLIKCDLKAGDKVLYGRYAGSNTKELGDDLIMDVDDILARIRT